MSKLTTLLLEWYEENGRALPWRVKGDAHPDPYVVLVSEFMLQQTTVKTVIPYFQKFMKRFPSIGALAKASTEQVYEYWQGLGYYTRARSLHKTAQMIMQDFGGVFPNSYKQVLKLKGIGPYTAASFLTFAFNKPETVVDGNVIRVICRLYHFTGQIADVMQDIRKKAEKLTSKKHPADYASAIMDLGAMVCLPKNPQCFRCPWQAYCRSKDEKNIEEIPQRKKLAQPFKEGFVYIVYDKKGRVFIRKRQEKGLLSGLYEFPWGEEPLFKDSRDTGLRVDHTFTHFRLTLHISLLLKEKFDGGRYIYLEDFLKYPSSTLMKKVFSKVQKLQII